MENTPSLRDIVSEDERKRLRKIKVASNKVKAVIYHGNLEGAGTASQFHEDVRIYGLWEALLYVKRYEEQGKYTVGTAQAAYEASKL